MAETRGCPGTAALAGDAPRPLSARRTPVERLARLAWRNGSASDGSRALADERAVALVFDGATHAVMMATPADLADFALGFSFTEGIIETPRDIASLEEVAGDAGIELRVWLAGPARANFTARRRALAGPTGCGLCGVESLARTLPTIHCVSRAASITPAGVVQAVAALAEHQHLHHETRAMHASALWDCDAGALIAVREDVGRHNALDKIVGHVLASGCDLDGMALVMTSRVSIELVQKTARLGIAIMVAVSAPTALAVRAAQEAGITLIAVARGDGFEMFTHGRRVVDMASARREVLCAR